MLEPLKISYAPSRTIQQLSTIAPNVGIVYRKCFFDIVIVDDTVKPSVVLLLSKKYNSLFFIIQDLK